MSLFKNKNFLLLWIGQFTSIIGTQISKVTISWWILEATGDNSSIVKVSIFTTLTAMIVYPFSGVLSDRFNRKKIIVLSDIIRGLIMIGVCIFALNTPGSLIPIYILLIMKEICTCFFSSSYIGIIPTIVKNENLGKAQSVTAFTRKISELAGPSFAGFLYNAIGSFFVFLIDGISFIISGISEMFIKIETKKKREKFRVKFFFSDLKESGKYLINNRTLFIMVIVVCTINLIGTPFSVLLPAYLKDILLKDAVEFGILQSSIAIGAALSALVFYFLEKHLSLFFTMLLGILLLGVTIILFSLTTNFYYALGIGVVHGFILIIINISFSVYIKKEVDINLIGKVNALITVILLSSAPLASLITLKLINVVDIDKIYLVCGIAYSISSLLILLIPELKSIRGKQG